MAGTMKKLYFLFTLVLLTARILAQDTSQLQVADSSDRLLIDSALMPDSAYRDKLKKGAYGSNQRLREKYLEQLRLSKQAEIYANLRAVFQRTKDYMKRGVDTLAIDNELDETQGRLEVAGEGIFNNKGSIQTARNVSTSSILLIELLDRSRVRQKQIDKYLGDLLEFRNNIDSLASDSLLFAVPEDSVDLKEFVQRLALFSKEIKPTDSMLNSSIKKMRHLETRADVLRGDVVSRIEDIESFHREISGNTLKKEVPYLWEPPGYTRPFEDIFRFSIRKASMVYTFYLKNHGSKIFFLLVVIVLFAMYLRSLKGNIIQTMGSLPEDLEKQIALRHPWATAALIVLSMGQFIFPTPPFAIYATIWTISGFCLSMMLWDFISGFWSKFWVLTLVHFLLACIFNLILQASRIERYFMLALAVAGVIGGMRFLLSAERKDLKENRLIIFLWLFVIMEGFSAITNIFGRYNLSKALLTSGYFNLVVGVCLLWTVSLLHDIFKLSAEAYRQDGKKRYYLDFDKMESEVPSVLYYLLGLGWFILIGRNFYVYKEITDPVVDFFSSERHIGAYSFSFSNILLFVFIIFLSAIASKIVSYFADDTPSTSAERKGGIGRWMLLIKIAIMSFGVFIAFAATGLPMDRIAIVFGALSVGIGFGLQNLFNNLASGLIIAFEKPLNVGDIVEIGGRSGTMKSIGFRSSVITTFEGSEVVIPNGDLLNQHLVNWTLNTTARRVEVIVGVDYATELEKTTQLIMDILAQDKRILTYPQSVVLVSNFGASSIDLRILFWVDNKDNWLYVKSDVMRSVKSVFTASNIQIPFPQMVLHSQPKPGNTMEEEKILK
jgi:potassium efflux system protein